MNDNPIAPKNQGIHVRIQHWIVWVNSLVILMALLVLLGWRFDIEVLRQPFPGLVAMNPMSAVCFMMAGTAFLLILYERRKSTNTYFPQLLSILIVFVGFFRVMVDFGGFDVGVDKLLFQSKMNANIVGGRPNVMATNTAICFMLTGASLLFVWNKKYFWAQLLTLFGVFISLLSIIGYTYGVVQFYGILSYFPMAVHTAICFLMLSVSILLFDGKEGFMSEVFSPYGGGKLARVLLPLAILIPVVLGFFRLYGERMGYYQTEFGTALYATIIIVVFVYLIWRSIVYVNKTSHALALEIAERKKVQESLESSNRFLETVLDNIPNMIFVKEADQLRFVRINKAGEDLLGLKRQNLIGKNDADFFSAEQSMQFRKKDLEAFSKKGAVTVDEEIIHTTRGERVLHTKKIPVFDTNGVPLYIVGISEDITEKKKKDSRLKESAREIFDLYNNAPCGYHSLDANGIIVDMNDTELRWLGYTRAEVIGKMNVSNIVSRPDLERFINSFEQFKREGTIHDLELKMRRSDGSEFPVLLSGTAVYDETGNYIRSRTTVFDFTERKALENVIHRFNRDLENKVNERTEELKQRAHELSVSNAELEQFAYVASHDLQEPLRMVTSFLTQLEKKYEGQLDEKARQYIHFATDGALRMRKIILDLLEYSRVGRKEFEREDVNINEIIEAVLVLNKNRITEKEAVVRWDPMPTIKASKSAIQQVFQNLIGNALKYQKKGRNPEVYIHATETPGYWQFAVSDNGIGIEPQFFEKIFVIFQRLHTRDEYSGTGIGLAICKKIVEIHKGRIWVESTPDAGSTFYFTISKN
ncbi:MAG: PAS domain S-box protein [Bacteroidetes bacterium]|nr:PAS domain S-box protein [Bacteroidota bacterium]